MLLYCTGFVVTNMRLQYLGVGPLIGQEYIVVLTHFKKTRHH